MSELSDDHAGGGAPPPRGAATRFLAHLNKRPWFNWILAAVLLGVAGYVTKSIEAAPGYFKEAFSEKTLISQSTFDYDGFCKGYVLKAQSLDQLGTAPFSNDTSDSEYYEGYGRSHGTITSPQRVMITITGYDKRPVTLTGMRVIATKQEKLPLSGVTMTNDCGDETVARYAEVDLDAKPPRIVDSSAEVVSYGASDPESDQPLETTPIRFPYTVKDTDTESLLLIAATDGYVEWYVEFNWSNGVEKGKLIVDQDGEPFKVTSGAKSMTDVTPSEEGWYHFTETSTEIIPNR